MRRFLGQVALISIDIGSGGEDTGTLFMVVPLQRYDEPPRSCLWATCKCYLKSCYIMLLRNRDKRKTAGTHIFLPGVLYVCWRWKCSITKAHPQLFPNIFSPSTVDPQMQPMNTGKEVYLIASTQHLEFCLVCQ